MPNWEPGTLNWELLLLGNVGAPEIDFIFIVFRNTDVNLSGRSIVGIDLNLESDGIVVFQRRADLTANLQDILSLGGKPPAA